jgi:PAS domain S-box-containing protein/putative nucleotidyltransferase with HDIG domain
VFSSDGKFIGVRGSNRDITERKKIEEALIESEKKFQSIFDFAVDGILIADSSTKKFFIGNKAICQMLGYSEEEIENIGLIDIHPAEEVSQIMEKFEMQTRKEATLFLDIPVKRKDGSVFYADINSSPIILGGKTCLMGIFRDATERWKAEEEVRKLSSAVEHSPAIVMITDTKGNIEYVNSKFSKVTGYTCEEVIGINAIDLGKSSPEETQQMWDALNIGQEWHGEFTNVKKNGEFYWEEAAIAPIKGQRDSISHFVKVAEDITYRKLSEQALNKRDVFLNSIIEQSPNPLWISDAHGTIIRMNQALKELLEITDEEIVGKYNVLKDEQVIAQGFLPVVESVFNEGKTVNFTIDYYTSKETKLKLSTDIHKIIDIVISPIIDDQGKVINAVCSEKDVTDKKLAEMNLSESEIRYRSLFEDSMDAIYITTSDGLFLEVNNAMCKLLGYSQKELLSTPVVNIYRNASDRTTCINNIEKNGYVKNFEVQFHKKDGSAIDVVVSANKWSSPNGQIKGYRGIAHDVTEQNQIEADRKRYNNSLHQAMISAVESIAALTEMRDPYTSGHQKRVAQLAVAIANKLKLSEHRIEGIRLASLIHDIGKINVPAEILSKPGKLSDIEYDLIKKHAEAAAEIIKPINFPWDIANVVVKHHERLDGSGYPKGLKGDQICLEARIISVADVVEAMSSHRPYRAALGLDVALKEIIQNKGILFDETVVNACVKLFKKEKFKFE